MSFAQELSSWLSPGNPTTSTPPSIDSPAPSTPLISLPSSRPTLLTFLRHCGCPFAEKTYLSFRDAASRHPDISFIAVSHSSQSATDTWLKSLPQAGSEPENLQMVVDEEKQAYAAWGLGVASFAHVLDPRSIMQISKISKEDGINQRPTESGSRWQTSGSYAVGKDGKVKWGRPMGRADEIPDFGEGIKAAQA